MIKVSVSGSFRRHMTAIYDAVVELVELGVNVLSPADPRVVDQIGEFVFVASDKVRSIKLVEDRHLECISVSDFLWLVAPDGYVGQSASMELGYAVARGIPIFCREEPTDGTLQKYVRLVPDVSSALTFAYTARRTVPIHHPLLIDPIGAIELAHNRLESLRGCLTRPAHEIADAEGEAVLHALRNVAPILELSGSRLNDVT
jgi:nucleoside 2-deoxyribosyltransferase